MPSSTSNRILTYIKVRTTHNKNGITPERKMANVTRPIKDRIPVDGLKSFQLTTIGYGYVQLDGSEALFMSMWIAEKIRRRRLHRHVAAPTALTLT
jgi:hypothetical protein